MLLTPLYLLADLLIALFLWADKHLAPLRVSKTGYANPRVRNMVHTLGYSSHTYHLTLPNIRKWLKDKSQLFPSVLQIQTINRCNGACEFCPYPSLERKGERMPDSLVDKVLRDIESV